jgi:hypothetical protein
LGQRPIGGEINPTFYSFGVVLLELITALKAIDNNRQGDKKDLASWVRFLFPAIYLTLLSPSSTVFPYT